MSTTAPLRYCNGRPGCPNKVARGVCADCAPGKREIERRHYTGIPGVNYGRPWQRAASAFLAKHPFCIDCQAEGIALGPATVVDHVIPHRGDRARFWDRSNWAPRCKTHHDRKTAREVFHRGR